MDVEKLLSGLVGIRSSIRDNNEDVLLVCVSRQEVDDVGDYCANTLYDIELGRARGKEFGAYAITQQATECVFNLSLAEIQSLKLKVKTLEQKLQAIDNVLKENV